MVLAAGAKLADGRLLGEGQECLGKQKATGGGRRLFEQAAVFGVAIIPSNTAFKGPYCSRGMSPSPHCVYPNREEGNGLRPKAINRENRPRIVRPTPTCLPSPAGNLSHPSVFEEGLMQNPHG